MCNQYDCIYLFLSVVLPNTFSTCNVTRTVTVRYIVCCCYYSDISITADDILYVEDCTCHRLYIM